MNVYLTAELKTYDDFISVYKEGDEKTEYDGISIMFYALSNNAPESRYAISNFLIDKGADVKGLNSNKENLLHVALSRVSHDIEKTTDICKLLVDRGVDINQLDNRGRVPLQYLMNMKYSDEDLSPLLQLWLSQEKLVLNHKNVWGKTVMELIAMLPYRTNMLERLKAYEKEHGVH